MKDFKQISEEIKKGFEALPQLIVLSNSNEELAKIIKEQETNIIKWQKKI